VERASRAATLISWARMVPVVALAWKADARVPAARVRLNAIAALTSQALLAPNFPDGRCARGSVLQVGDDLLDDRVPAVGFLRGQHRQRDVGEDRVVAVDGEQLTLLCGFASGTRRTISRARTWSVLVREANAV
jgi:hypothetical protein